MSEQLRKAAQDALEALGVAVDHYRTYHGHPARVFREAIDALRAALAAEQWRDTIREAIDLKMQDGIGKESSDG